MDILQLFVRNDLSIVEKMKEVAGTENIDILINTISKISDQDVYQFLQSSNYSSFRFLWIRNIWIADSPLVSVSGKSISIFSGIWNGVFILPILAGTSYYRQNRNPSGAMSKQRVSLYSLYCRYGLHQCTCVRYLLDNSNIFQIVQQIIYNLNQPEGRCKNVKLETSGKTVESYINGCGTIGCSKG